MRHPRYLVLAPLLLLPFSSFAQPSLCTAGEVTEWSCTARGKIYSLCASSDLSPTSGYMQYRAGNKSKLEFAFPAQRQHPRDHFRLSLAPRGAVLSFDNHGYEYWIYEPLAGPTRIDVSKGQAPVGSIICSSATDTLTLTKTQDRFRSLGIYP